MAAENLENYLPKLFAEKISAAENLKNYLPKLADLGWAGGLGWRCHLLS